MTPSPQGIITNLCNNNLFIEYIHGVVQCPFRKNTHIAQHILH